MSPIHPWGTLKWYWSRGTLQQPNYPTTQLSNYPTTHLVVQGKRFGRHPAMLGIARFCEGFVTPGRVPGEGIDGLQLGDLTVVCLVSLPLLFRNLYPTNKGQVKPQSIAVWMQFIRFLGVIGVVI